MPQSAIQSATAAQKVAQGAQASVQGAPQAAIQSTELAPGVDTATQAIVTPEVVDTSISLWQMFGKADFVVMVVMLLLIATSVWCWAIMFNKYRKMRFLNNQAEAFEEAFWSGGSLDQLYDRVSNRTRDPMSVVFSSAMREWRRSVTKGFVTTELRTTLQQRIERVMQLSIGREMEGIERHMGFLASVGSTAPFVGLFGTVWGIMNSFQAIAVSQNTSLAVVAPGIAEALFVTALGLVAAIPAVLGYNKLSSDINRYGNRLDSFSNEFTAIISRQLEEHD